MTQSSFYDWRKNVHQFLGKDFWADFQDVFKQEWPLVNVYQNDRRLMCLIAVPGVEDKKDIELYVQHQVLMIRGKSGEKPLSFQPVSEEFSIQTFERTVDLPFPVNPSPLEATYKKGVLKLILERIEPKDQQGIMVVEED